MGDGRGRRFYLLAGFFTFMLGGFFERNEASLAAFFIWHPWLYLFLVPAAGMRIWSEERRSQTLELLFTLPTTTSQAIVGKYAAGAFFLALALVLTFPIILTVDYLGNPDMGVILCGYLGSFMIALVFLAISTLTSSLTRNQVVSFIISVLACLLLILSGWPPVTDMFVQWAPAWLVDMVAAFSIMPHYEGMQRGVLDVRDAAYAASFIFFALFSTNVVLKNHRVG